MNSRLHVAVGVIKNSNEQFLISRRSNHLHQGGLWEFPGGKVEQGETAYDALCRELHEELNIDVVHAEPLVKISYAYPDKHVLLDVWLVDKFKGIAASQQQQPLQWVSIRQLFNYSFPAANQAILSSLLLPPCYAITGVFDSPDDFLKHLRSCLKAGIKLVQLRSKSSSLEELHELAESGLPVCKKYGASLLVNSNAEFLHLSDVDGIHLSSKHLLSYTQRPVKRDKLLAASVHNLAELKHATSIDVDFVVVSPVLETLSHPGAAVLGWSGLAEILAESSIPVYALGGMKQSLIARAKQTGAIGIAAISEFWQVS